MKIKIVLITIFTIILVVFVLQNTEVVAVKLWFWNIKVSRALLILICIAFGLIIGLMIPSGKKKTILKTVSTNNSGK